MKIEQKRYADFNDAFAEFVKKHCIPYEPEFDAHSDAYITCDIRVHINSSGGGYIHLLNQDSDTIDFATMNHYSDTNTPKPKHLL